MYEGYLKPEQITAIDSKLQLYFHICSGKTEGEINEFIEKSEFKAAGYYWLKTKQRAEFLQLLQKESNFDQVINMLDKFATKAHYIQLLDFLYMITRGYEALTQKIKERLIIIYGSESPEILNRKIEEKKDEIAQLEEKLHEGIERIRREYIDDSGIIQQEAKEAFDKFKKELSSAEGKENTEKKILEGVDLFSKAQIDIPKRVITDCNQKLIEISDSTSIPTATIIPVFPSDYFNKLFIETKDSEESQKTWYDPEICWIFGGDKHSEYSLYKHIEFLKKKVLDDLNVTKEKMIGSLFNYVVIIINEYSKNLKVNVDNKNIEYDKLCFDLDTSEKMREEAIKLEKDLSDIRLASEKVNSIKGAIEDAVKN